MNNFHNTRDVQNYNFVRTYICQQRVDESADMLCYVISYEVLLAYVRLYHIRIVQIISRQVKLGNGQHRHLSLVWGTEQRSRNIWRLLSKIFFLFFRCQERRHFFLSFFCYLHGTPRVKLHLPAASSFNRLRIYYFWKLDQHRTFNQA